MQKRRARKQGAVCVLSCLMLCGIPARAWAQVTATVGESTYLGDWLVQHHFAMSSPASDDKAALSVDQLYTRALIWTRPREKALQEVRWNALLLQVRYLATKPSISVGHRDKLYQFIASRLPTGRIAVRSGDARWLQANPQSDPMLSPGDSIQIPLRPSTVTMIREDGTVCVIPYKPNVEVAYYIKACDPDSKADIAWVAQPDGTLDKSKIGLWNRERQDPVIPGAWIWAPGRSSGWPEEFSDRFGQFLATQPPSGIDATNTILEPSNSPPEALAAAAPLIRENASDLAITTNDWGNEGLMQTPSARMGAAGEASISFTNVNPYTRLNVMLHPLDWFEFGFRYTDISNHLYGAAALSGTQSYKDKSIDAKIRLWTESAYIPQVAVGLMDIGGTGLFSGEYLVASKRTGGFDWSLGLGWGYIGARGDITNPLSIISDKFKVRPNGSGSGSSVAGGVGKSFFRGPMALFGGVQYQLPNLPLVFKVEYDGNDYKQEPFGYNANAKLPVNFGIVWRANKNFDLSAGFERGNRAMLGISFHGNLANISTQKINDPAPLPISAITNKSKSSDVDWSKTSADLTQQTRWRVLGISQQNGMLTVSFDGPDSFYRKDILDRIATVLHRDAPSDINTFRVVTEVEGQTMRSYIIRRGAWVKSKTQAVPPIDVEPTVLASAPPSGAALDAAPKLFEQPYKRFYYSIGPGYSQTLGGPDGFVLYSLSATINAALRLRSDTWVAGGLSYRVLDNYGHFTYTAPSQLPRVRTFMREYMTTSRFNIPYLQATHVGKIGPNQFYSVYGGMLESEFGGIGAEWLYRPASSRLAIGIDANAVRQRDFNQEFGFRHYQTLTGHVTAYWDTGWNDVLVQLSVGQYLAKDKGATLDISRRFQNGVAIGAYATKTNVSAAQFGEGSFDKGIYVQIPFDAIMGRSVGGLANLAWQPLTRDGGAKLNRQFPLYDLTDERNPKNLWFQPNVATDK